MCNALALMDRPPVMKLHACAALQFWTPTILAERGVRDLRVLGLASAAPWAVTS